MRGSRLLPSGLVVTGASLGVATAVTAFFLYPAGSAGAGSGVISARAGGPGAAAPSSASTSWTVEKSPSAKLPAVGHLSDVSCAGADACVAVGFYDRKSSAIPLAEVWDGTTWSIQTPAIPAGATSSDLSSISCSAPDSCEAVGSGSPGGAFAEAWDGTTWTLQTLPGPCCPPVPEGISCSSPDRCEAVGDAGLAEVWNGRRWKAQTVAVPTGARGAELQSVWCGVGSGDCEAVGSYETSSALFTLAELWDGSSWTIQSTPNPNGSQYPGLDSVSCTGPAFCEAVGSWQSAKKDRIHTLAEVWDGTSWSLQSSPNQNGATDNLLGSVSCASDTECEAVGQYVDDGGVSGPLAESWDGSEWTIQPLPAAESAPGAESAVTGVSCVAAGTCEAVGDADENDLYLPVAIIWDGSTWSTQQAAPSPLVRTEPTELDAVSCVTATDCEAVGDVYGGLAVKWDGKSWSIQEGCTAPCGPTGVLLGLSCPAANACEAVGGGPAAVWNGSEWTEQAVPTPSGADEGSAALTGVSCTTASSCEAVGSYVVGSGPSSEEVAYAEGWNGSSWQLQSVPAPDGSEQTSLQSVSCAPGGTCEAVGYYYNDKSKQKAYAMAWDGSEWDLQAVPLRAGQNSLYSVSCSGPAFCEAVGEDLPERWDGTSWAAQTLPGSGSPLDGVSCESATSCEAVGSGFDDPEGLAYRWDGKSWSAQTVPGVAGFDTGLAGVSCASAKSCEAVGNRYKTKAGNVTEEKALVVGYG